MAWDELEVARLVEQAREADEAICRDFAAVFNTPAGQRVLRFLESGTVDQPVADPEKPSAWASFREGENNIVRRIRAYIARGNGPDPRLR